MSEIELLERVLLRLGCSDTDEQLQNMIMKFLPPVLEKICSPEEKVRLKVMEVLTHINKRLKTRPLIQLPVESILKLYASTQNAFAMNFSIIYITMGFPRMTTEDQTSVAPVLLASLTGKPEVHQDKLLTLVVPLLGTIKIPDDPVERRKVLGLSDDEATKMQLISFLQDVLLFPYGTTQDMDVPHGMSAYSFKRIIVNNWKAEELEEYKKGLVRFLSSGVFPDDDVLLPLIIASADTRFSVATPALAELNKICITIDWENPKLTEPLYIIFSGNNHKIKDKKSKPSNVRVRQKLLQYLLKCRRKGISEVRGLQVVFEALFGEQTNQKCKILALQFCENMIKEGDKMLIKKLAKVLFDGINKLLASQEPFDVQNAAYSALSQLIHNCPEILNRDLEFVSKFFKILTQSPVEIQESIKEVLLAIAPAFHHTLNDNVSETLLLALLTDFVTTKMNIVKKVVIVYLTSCFKESFIPARYSLLLLLEGEEKSSLRELIMTSLYGVTKKDNVDLKKLTNEKTPSKAGEEMKILPDFNEIAKYCFEMAQKRKDKQMIKDGLAFPVDIYSEILYYIRTCLWISANLKTPPANGCPQLKSYVIKSFESHDGVRNYVFLIKDLLMKSRGYVPLSCLFDIFNSIPEGICKEKLGDDLIFPLENGLKDVTEDTRTIIAQLFGILIAYNCTDVEFEGYVKKLITGSGKSLEHKHGAYLAAAYAFRQRISNQKAKKCEKELETLETTVLTLVLALKDTQSLIVSSAIKGLSFIAHEVKLPIRDQCSEMEVDGEDSNVFVPSKEELLNLLLKIITSNGAKQKLKEEACECLASLTFCDGEYFTTPILKRFLKMNKLTKDAAIHIAIGQAIVKIILGDNERMDLFDEDGKVTAGREGHFSDENLEWLVLELVDLVNRELHPNSRQCCCIWLLGIVKSSSQRPIIQKNRELLQLAFTELLSEDNELVQDVASRGLGELFNVSDEEKQSELANSLLDQLTGNQQKVMKVTSDTKVFEEGTLGKTPTGDNISTYKELCNLASDLNQPDLIYQFMQLANHNATWNNKLGAAFGLKSISKIAKINMEPHLIKIVPRLYRYKYDPTPKIQHSMTSIWDSIVSNTKETVDLYYWEILEDLNKNLTSPEWRTRMSCCLGVRDLIKNGIKTRTTEESSESEIETELLELWRQIFRVMDDIHEGTRLAAEGTANTLSKVCIVATSADKGKSGIRVAKTILPFILETGVTNIVPEVRKISIKTVSEIIDTSGTALVPHLTQLIPCLLQATGELEVSKLSYLSTRFGGQSDIQEALDSARAEAAKQHHTMQTLTKCIRFVDYETMEKITPQILDLMKSSVNLGTKIACAHFICLVSIRLGKDMTPLAGKYITACSNGLSDRNPTVRKYYASSIGHLMGVAKDQSIAKLLQKLQEYYNDRTSNKSQAVPTVLHAINKRYPEVLKDHSAIVLPLIFFAMHEESTDENKDRIEQWTDLWNDVSPGEAGIRMNLDTIIPNLIKFLDDSSWSLKIQSANAIKMLSDKLGKNVGDAERETLIKCLLAALIGRTFNGKERLLQALASLCKNYNRQSEPDELCLRVIDAVMRESRKEEPVYRTHCLRALGDVLNSLHEDRFEDVYNMVWHLLDKTNGQDSSNNEDNASDLTAEERSKRMVVNIQLKETVCETLGKAWPMNSVETQEKYQLKFVEKCVECLSKNTRPVQLSLLIALGRFLERLKIFESQVEAEDVKKKIKVDEAEVDAVIEKICKIVLQCIEEISTIPHTGLKKESLNILLILIKKLAEKPNSHRHLVIVKEKYDSTVEAFRRDHAPEIKCRLLDIEDKLKNL